MLEDKLSSLEEMLNYFKELWDKLIKFLQDKFFSTNKYDNIIDELYEKRFQIMMIQIQLKMNIAKMMNQNDKK